MTRSITKYTQERDKINATALGFLNKGRNSSTVELPFLLVLQVAPPLEHRDRGNIGFHNLMKLRGKINTVATTAKPLFHKFIDHSNNQCPEFVAC